MEIGANRGVREDLGLASDVRFKARSIGGRAELLRTFLEKTV